MKPKTNTMQREKEALQQQVRDLNKKICVPALNPKELKDGVISLIFKISTNSSDREESLKHLHAFVDMFNKQKNMISGFIIHAVKTDFSILDDVIKIQLVNKFSSDYVISGFTYNMTFDMEGMLDTDLPHIYTEKVWS